MTINLEIKSSGESVVQNIQLNEGVFGVEYKEPLIHQVVTAYRAGGRLGTRAQKNRAAVRGGGRKPYKQKGGGRARAGTRSSPIWRGGGVSFPASLQDFSQKVNRKMYRAAMRSIFSELLRQNRVVVVDELSFQTWKTKSAVAVLSELGFVKGLVVVDEINDNLERALLNVAHIDVCLSEEINPLNLVFNNSILLTKKALNKIEEALQ